MSWSRVIFPFEEICIAWKVTWNYHSFFYGLHNKLGISRTSCFSLNSSKISSRCPVYYWFLSKLTVFSSVYWRKICTVSDDWRKKTWFLFRMWQIALQVNNSVQFSEFAHETNFKADPNRIKLCQRQNSLKHFTLRWFCAVSRIYYWSSFRFF